MKVQNKVPFSEQVVAIIWKLWQGKRAQSRMPKMHGNSNCVVDQWMSPVNDCFSKMLGYTNVRLITLYHTGVVTMYFCEFPMTYSWQHISWTLKFHYSPHFNFAIYLLLVPQITDMTILYSHKVLNVLLMVTLIISVKLLW